VPALTYYAELRSSSNISVSTAPEAQSPAAALVTSFRPISASALVASSALPPPSPPPADAAAIPSGSTLSPVSPAAVEQLLPLLVPYSDTDPDWGYLPGSEPLLPTPMATSPASSKVARTGSSAGKAAVMQQLPDYVQLRTPDTGLRYWLDLHAQCVVVFRLSMHRFMEMLFQRHGLAGCAGGERADGNPPGASMLEPLAMSPPPSPLTRRPHSTNTAGGLAPPRTTAAPSERTPLESATQLPAAVVGASAGGAPAQALGEAAGPPTIDLAALNVAAASVFRCEHPPALVRARRQFIHLLVTHFREMDAARLLCAYAITRCPDALNVDLMREVCSRTGSGNRGHAHQGTR